MIVPVPLFTIFAAAMKGSWQVMLVAPDVSMAFVTVLMLLQLVLSEAPPAAAIPTPAVSELSVEQFVA